MTLFWFQATTSKVLHKTWAGPWGIFFILCECKLRVCAIRANQICELCKFRLLDLVVLSCYSVIHSCLVLALGDKKQTFSKIILLLLNDSKILTSIKCVQKPPATPSSPSIARISRRKPPKLMHILKVATLFSIIMIFISSLIVIFFTMMTMLIPGLCQAQGPWFGSRGPGWRHNGLRGSFSSWLSSLYDCHDEEWGDI